MLDKVDREAKNFFNEYIEQKAIGKQPVGFMSAADFDNLFKPFHPIPDDLSDEEKNRLKQANEEILHNKLATLANAFFPYLQRTLTRHFIIQTQATAQNAEPALVEALLTDTRLLTDPNQSDDKPLLDAFAGIGVRGVSATYFKSVVGQFETATIVTADTSAKGIDGNETRPKETNKIRLAGFFEVPIAGTYRFFVEIDKPGAKADLQFPNLPEPSHYYYVAEENEAENHIDLELKAGVLYQFILETDDLNDDSGEQNDDNVRLLVQGANLPKGSLKRLILYPLTVVERVRDAQVLLTKSLQIIQNLELSEREVRYLLARSHGSTSLHSFDYLDLRKLPVQAAVIRDAPVLAEAKALFQAFLRLLDYARLKRELARGSDDLIEIFVNARRTFRMPDDEESAETGLIKLKTELFEAQCQRFADLTRRDFEAVKATAEHLNFASQSSVNSGNEIELTVEVPEFADEKALWRLWEALQIVHKLGVPVESIVNWTKPGWNFEIARDVRNTIKARYSSENWLRIAQPIFDKLRQRQRDALVAYVLHKHPENFQSINQLFEYFLIDPGMEPVVQTSRIRLAISSVQLFIQRCLLNLEPWVHPSAIDSRHWRWMKRYRVWEANRKIFLFPENWLEPEFRDDKTHLFQELESTLLQDDITNELAEQALFKYLKQFEEIARLEIVTMYRQKKPEDTIHVIGRTYNLPHKYFYRRYNYEGNSWTPWEPVTADIEGDHVVAVVWKQRLHLFWLTFLEKQTEISDSTQTPQERFEETSIASATPLRNIEIQLNWTEYFQGQWTTRESSGFGDPIGVTVTNEFNYDDIFIHASKEKEDSKENQEDLVDGALNINLRIEKAANYYVDISGGGFLNEPTRMNRGFRLFSKNSPHKIKKRNVDPPQSTPYSENTTLKVTQYQASEKTETLTVTFRESFYTKDGTPIDDWSFYDRNNQLIEQEGKKDRNILWKAKNYSLLMGNYPPPDDKYPSIREINALESPFFYQDDEHTFFVQINREDKSIKEIDAWWTPQNLIEELNPDVEEIVEAQPPRWKPPPRGPWPEPGWSSSGIAKYRIKAPKDWLTDPTTGFEFDDSVVVAQGRLDVITVPDDMESRDSVMLTQVNNRRVINVIGRYGLSSTTLNSLRNRYRSLRKQ